MAHHRNTLAMSPTDPKFVDESGSASLSPLLTVGLHLVTLYSHMVLGTGKY